MNTQLKRLMSLTLVSTAALLAAPSARAESNFAKQHPRRAEVLKRDRNEMKKNKQAYKDGEITKDQEKALNKEDREIKRQEQADAAANGGHITKAEQAQLNSEENAVNRQRTQDEKADSVGTTPNG